METGRQSGRGARLDSSGIAVDRRAMPADVLRQLEEEAKHLASHHYLVMAANLLQYYDGECAEETKIARLQLAKQYFDSSRSPALKLNAPASGWGTPFAGIEKFLANKQAKNAGTGPKLQY